MASAGRSTTNPRFRRILEQAARLIHQHGFEATSMQAIADACDLTKAGIYHYIQTKEDLLVAIMHYGMDLFEEEVLEQVVGIADPIERLRQTMARHLRLIETAKEITIIVNEYQALTRTAQRELNVRRKRYVRLLEDALREAIERQLIRPVDPTVAAFSFLGVVMWTPNWYRPDGRIPLHKLTESAFDMYLKGLLPQ
jgi:AcrR family transcriptional regulator